MTLNNDEVIRTLNDLIETCKDGQNGFKTAAEALEGSPHRALFQEYSRQRARMAGELQQEVRRLGGDPEKSGSVSASLHRGWINLKAAVTGKDEGAIISEAERGEDVAKGAYQSALKQDLPASVKSLIDRQYAEVKSAHDRVRALEVAKS
jgi:uncharacterized protein (TIGR02284 family)